MKEEIIAWMVEGQTLEAQQQTLQIKELLVDRLIDKCLVPIDYNKRNNNGSIKRVNKIIETVKENKTVEPIVILQDRKRKKNINVKKVRMKDRFSVAGTHIMDSRDEGWMPEAGTRTGAEMIVEKLNELVGQIPEPTQNHPGSTGKKVERRKGVCMERKGR